ncbi:MAG: hypothetical protein AMK73_07440 [Planctomycetes bacterium SM23_32]|nr:MAG: hypothetical protein AMK73_07440 [Planctomycetes bacterium SM23_32]
MLVAVAAVVGLHFSGVLRDAPPPDDADLRMVRLDIPPEENAFTYLEALQVRLYGPQEGEGGSPHGIVHGKAWDAAAAADLLKRNEEALSHFDRALECRRLQMPAATEGPDRGRALSGCQEVALLNRLRARWLLREGRHREALERAMAGVRFAQMIEQSAGGIPQWQLGASVKRVALETLQEMLAEAELPPELWRRHAAALAECGASRQGLADALRAEYVLAARTVDQVAGGDHGLDARLGWSGERARRSSYHFQPNRTKRALAATFRAIIANAPLSFAQRDFSGVASGSDPVLVGRRIRALDNPASWIIPNRPNMLGRALIAVLTPDYARIHEEKCVENVRVGATRALLALKAYKLEHGELPDSLDALVPDYVNAVPSDDFDGEPLRYSREKRVVYSVGRDLVDDGGVEPTDAWTREEMVFPIEF